MFFGHISKVNKKQYPAAIQLALDYLASTDFDKIEAGRYPIKGDLIYAQVLDLETKDKSAILPEVHRKYLDVQYLHAGKERMGVTPALSYAGGNKGWIGDNPFIYLDTKKIRSLGWKPELTIQQAVERTVDYIMQNGWMLK